jgi:hypothetical protein
LIAINRQSPIESAPRYSVVSTNSSSARQDAQTMLTDEESLAST